MGFRDETDALRERNESLEASLRAATRELDAGPGAAPWSVTFGIDPPAG